MNRRRFVQAGTALVGFVLAACGAPSGSPAERSPIDRRGRRWHMPDEGDPHERTWMAFAAREDIWGKDRAPGVQRSLALIATAIARFEPVSMLVSADQMGRAKELIGNAPGVTLVAAELDDLWIRDTGPVFVKGDQGLAGVDFNFNGWGNKQRHTSDARVAGLVTAQARAEVLRTDLVLEGGGIEVDGEGTAIITESCVLNDNRNPGWTKQQVEAELSDLLGIDRVIWLPGIKGRDITDGHTDFYARFASPGVVVAGLDEDPESFDYDVTRRHLDILRGATDAKGRGLTVEVLRTPSTVREAYAEDDDFAAGYINFYLCNGAVISPQFGDAETDGEARATLQRLFPGREVVQLDIDPIAGGGGGIHCATQQQPVR
ncbi:Agmatine deiminase OS=Tsukamurella paurometabola (strain ATCC 8368 / DSM / CCUG 35730 / CIP 100753 / JCM 10117 / KCTC 9821 / NBRC 16120 / NCIMB 702349 /NCTC 13040) OX=521096 GN=Tpau_0172 PE=4 SV=1 [Tsukamurella paurometabola]|uniref:Agmatine deiminase n=1 Tax=Tsukamurella paurometabola (strain ATCC 8368 / DSM 20162 / CCUG 35730 / CIP 100753 / JCM 10117 / KCTC 9821 / NBRC 16120 / NCIMB 702349 / NCTC 13040) TaxID=521096 RepID=D5UQJ3_TSUPD|nr:agmatine deiminase family protein [Tsukamurella paurometabola]ADG76826.1 Agmatine deiminase [Tsukamurella paurometabola DSM 20162]SUP41802.1 Agmatine deiminase [Tsukamurella paurometabola]